MVLHLRWNDLLMVYQMLFEIEENCIIFYYVKESRSNSFVSGATGSSSSVNIVDDVSWSMVVDNMLDVVNVYTSCCYISTDKDISVSVTKRIKAFLSLLLVLATMQRRDTLSKSCEMIMQCFNIVFHVDENHNWRLWITIKQRSKLLLSL